MGEWARHRSKGSLFQKIENAKFHLCSMRVTWRALRVLHTPAPTPPAVSRLVPLSRCCLHSRFARAPAAGLLSARAQDKAILQKLNVLHAPSQMLLPQLAEQANGGAGRGRTWS